MKRTFCQLFILFTIMISRVWAMNAAEIRTQFDSACTDRKKAELFLNNLSVHGNSPLIEGYSAATETIMARFCFNPFEKYRYCKNGMERLNRTISKSPATLELRYLRIVLQYNLPKFLNLSGHIEEDKKSILRLIRHSDDHDLNRRVAVFLTKNKLCSESETAAIQKYL